MSDVGSAAQRPEASGAIQAPIDQRIAARWIELWDRQQGHYADHREQRFTAMIDIVEQALATHTKPVVVDLGAGPGSLAARLARRLPHARVLAVESDPFLVELGRAWCGDAVQFVRATAGAPGWRALPDVPHVDAVLASAALHYPSAARLSELYADLFDWLTPGGILLNADHFPDLVNQPGQPTADVPPDLMPWTQWWHDVAADPQLAPLLALRGEWPTDTTHDGDNSDSDGDVDGDNGLGAADHLAMLRSAGYDSVELAWRRGRSAIVAAAAPGEPAAAADQAECPRTRR